MPTFTRYGLPGLATAVAAAFLAVTMARLGMAVAEVSFDSGRHAAYGIQHAAAALPGAALLHLGAMLALLALTGWAWRGTPAVLRCCLPSVWRK